MCAGLYGHPVVVRKGEAPSDICIQGRMQGEIPHQKPMNVTLFTMILYNYGKQHLRYKAILPSIVLSQ